MWNSGKQENKPARIPEFHIILGCWLSANPPGSGILASQGLPAV
jgi:hypothetical protein